MNIRTLAFLTLFLGIISRAPSAYCSTTRGGTIPGNVRAQFLVLQAIVRHDTTREIPTAFPELTPIYDMLTPSVEGTLDTHAFQRTDSADKIIALREFLDSLPEGFAREFSDLAAEDNPGSQSRDQSHLQLNLFADLPIPQDGKIDYSEMISAASPILIESFVKARNKVLSEFFRGWNRLIVPTHTASSDRENQLVKEARMNKVWSNKELEYKRLRKKFSGFALIYGEQIDAAIHETEVLLKFSRLSPNFVAKIDNLNEAYVPPFPFDDFHDAPDAVPHDELITVGLYRPRISEILRAYGKIVTQISLHTPTAEGEDARAGHSLPSTDIKSIVEIRRLVSATKLHDFDQVSDAALAEVKALITFIQAASNVVITRRAKLMLMKLIEFHKIASTPDSAQTNKPVYPLFNAAAVQKIREMDSSLLRPESPTVTLARMSSRYTTLTHLSESMVKYRWGRNIIAFVTLFIFAITLGRKRWPRHQPKTNQI